MSHRVDTSLKEFQISRINFIILLLKCLENLGILR